MASGTWLLARHAAAQVAPLALLVPVFGMGGAALFLDEWPSPVQGAGAALVMTGLAVTVWPRRGGAPNALR